MPLDLPANLRGALDAELRGIDPRRLARLTGDLVERYRGGRPARGGAFLASDEEVAAYAAYRMPATFAAVAAALEATAEQWPGDPPRSLLDAGAGPGTAAWAARALLPSLERVSLLERDARMIDFGRRLATRVGDPLIAGAGRRQVDLLADWQAEPHDLVVMAYVLNEISEERRAALVERLWATAGQGLLLVEPGTPAGFAGIREARRQLIAAGGTVLAPCPHDEACPMPHGDWCHFARRVTRSRLHREVKGGELPYEDEKISYVAVGRAPAPAIAGRVIRHPQYLPGRVALSLCAPEGLRTEIVTRASGRETYRRARDLRWGDALLPGDEPHG